MKKIRHLLAILMTVTMIVSGGGLDSFAAHAYAAEDQGAPAVSEEQGVETNDAAEPSDSAAGSDESKAAADNDLNKEATPEKDDPTKSEKEDAKAENSASGSDSAADAGDAVLQAKIKLSDENEWIVTAQFNEKAGIPDNAKLEIEEVEQKYHADYLDEAKETLKWTEEDQTGYSRFLNISITSKGKEIKPAANVEFSLESKDIEKNIDEMQVVRFDVNKDEIVKSEKLKCEVTKDKALVFKTDEVGAFGLVALKKTETGKADPDKNGRDDTDLVEKTLKAGKVRLEGMMPEDAKASVKDASDAKAVKKLEADGGTTLAAYDISIKADGTEYQPDADNPILVQISNQSIKKDSNLSVWHIKDDGTKEEVKDFTVENGKVLFDATGFSVYVVIDHEEGTVENPRVEFHFISPDAEKKGTGSEVYYEGAPYEFKNKGVDHSVDPEEYYEQTTQVLKDGESLEQIIDPGNKEAKDFYGWYVVDPYVIADTTDEYGIGLSNSSLYYKWPANPDKITFKSPITITESNVDIGDTVNWSLHGVSGSGVVDKDGNVHVFLAPVYDDYSFVTFMRFHKPEAEADDQEQDSNSIMARKLVVRGSADSLEVKISDVESTSTDSVHVVFTGWEYNAGTEEEPNWVQIPTIDDSGAEITGNQTEEPVSGVTIKIKEDGVYLCLSDLQDASNIVLYPIFIEARWVDFVTGISGSGASYVNSRYLQSWGSATPEGTPDELDKNYFASLDTSAREGFEFDGWYAFAATDPDTGEITNLRRPADIELSYLDYSGNKRTKKTVTINTTAVKVANADGSVNNDCGTWSITNSGALQNNDSGQILFKVSGDKLKFYDSLDRLKLFANWTPGNSKITVVYWTENAQEKGYTPHDNPKMEYTSSAVKTITTSEINDQLGTSYMSGSTIDLAGLEAYKVDCFNPKNRENPEEHYDPLYVSILDPRVLSNDGEDELDGVKAVPEGEGKFYELNRDNALTNASVVIKGDGSTTYNVYFSRSTFNLVFHIGRDGYVKNGGHQKTAEEWDGNWIEFMYRDAKVLDLGYEYSWNRTHGRNPADSYRGLYTMKYDGNTYTSAYETSKANVKGDYVPNPEENENDENVYVITAKYGAYIGDRWPTPTNPNFEFTDPEGKTKTMYIWAAYYGSLYCRIANERSTVGNQQGANPDINGVYNYMSAELCSNRAGTDIINDNRVHHLVAYFGEKSNQRRYKQYHILYEAIDGTYDTDSITTVPGNNYEQYKLTTWSQEHTEGDKSEIIGHDFYEAAESPKAVISNLEPQFQLSDSLDGYDLVYSCYDSVQHQNPETGHDDYHIYFFYRPKQYDLTFMYENEADRKTDTYYYKQTLADAKKYPDPVPPEGYEFQGWYTNEEGIGDPFDFTNETMPCANVVLYPKISSIRYVVKIDPNGGVIDHRVNSARSTYFNGYYGAPIGEYEDVERNYIELSEKEKDASSSTYYSGTKYYYVNTQYNEAHDGDWGLPPDLRNAVYLTEDELETYYTYYKNTIDENKDYYTGITPLSYDAFLSAYTSYPDHPYRPLNTGSEYYSFMGWYQVYEDGTEASMPYNFNDPVEGPMELRAMWRLEDSYYVQYEPCFLADDGHGSVTEIVGEMDQWTDPKDPATQSYADQSPTHILRAPTNVTEGWVFRGWRVVKPSGTTEYEGKTYINWEPIQFDTNGDPVYYQPGDNFTIDSALVSEKPEGGNGSVIHMQAYYESVDSTYRKPDVTNLILDSNDLYGSGYVNTSESSDLPALAGPGSTAINKTTELYDGHPTQILLGDIQSNLALHMYRYATTKTYNEVKGTNFFTSDEGYLLIGFDENADPDNPKTGEAYVPTFAADSVAAVTRKDHITLYAMWEPMVYATFVNTTEEPITIKLTGSGANTVSVINIVTGEFGREQSQDTITIPAKSGDKNGEVKVALPKAVAETDSLTATATNDHIGTKMTVSGQYQNQVPYGEGSSAVPYSGDVSYTGTLQQDKDGIIVTYSEIPDRKVIFDVNDGTWTEESEDYVSQGGDIYSIDEDKIVDNDYKPADPTRSGKVFLGWTTNADIAAHTDFSSEEAVTWGDTTITPDAGSNVLDKIKDEYLWDFSQDPPYDQILYAVWSDTVTVTFDMTYDGSKLHTWTGPETSSTQEPNVFYRSDPNSSSVTYTLAKGGQVPKPEDPTAHSDKPAWSFIKWLTSNNTTKSYRNTAKKPNDSNLTRYAFDFSERITSDKTVVTSWTESKPQHFTFTIENHVVNGSDDEEFEYTIGVSDEWVYGKRSTGSGSTEGPPDEKWGAVSTTLKNGQQYKVLITVSQILDYGGDYSVLIEVVDHDGNVIKSGQAFYCAKNTNKNFVADYKYKLNISQANKDGYVTTVDVPEEYIVNVDAAGISYSEDNSGPFTFSSSRSRNGRDSFLPEVNEYAEDENNSLKIVFTNTAPPIVAPTGYGSYLWPLIWMLILGMFLWTAMTYMRRRRSLETFAMEAATADTTAGHAYDSEMGDSGNSGDHMDAPAETVAQDSAEEIQREPDEPVYEAFDWTRITI